MSHTSLPITRLTAGEGKIIQLKTFKQNQLDFPPKLINEYEHNNRPLQSHEFPRVDRLLSIEYLFTIRFEMFWFVDHVAFTSSQY